MTSLPIGRSRRTQNATSVQPPSLTPRATPPLSPCLCCPPWGPSVELSGGLSQSPPFNCPAHLRTHLGGADWGAAGADHHHDPARDSDTPSQRRSLLLLASEGAGVPLEAHPGASRSLGAPGPRPSAAPQARSASQDSASLSPGRPSPHDLSPHSILSPLHRPHGGQVEAGQASSGSRADRSLGVWTSMRPGWDSA